MLSFLRFAFVIIFPMCNIVIDGRKTPILLYSNVAYILILAAISITGGILSGQAMSYAGQIAPKHLADDVGNTMGTCLVAGLLGGASFSFVVIALI